MTTEPEKKTIQLPPKPEPFILEQREFCNEKGQRITERLLVDGIFPEHLSPFTGHAHVEVKTFNGAGTANVDFPIEGATNIVEAFAMVDEAFEVVQPQLRKQFEEQARQKQPKQPSIEIAGERPAEPKGRGRMKLL